MHLSSASAAGWLWRQEAWNLNEVSATVQRLQAPGAFEKPEIPTDTLKVDLARHMHRPGTRGPAAGQNFLYDSAREQIRDLGDHELYRNLPMSYRLCRVYAETNEYDAVLAGALDTLVGPNEVDDRTNM